MLTTTHRRLVSDHFNPAHRCQPFAERLRGYGAATIMTRSRSSWHASPGHPFYKTVECAALAEAAKLGVDLEIQGMSNFEIATQTTVLFRRDLTDKARRDHHRSGGCGWYDPGFPAH